jgi:signal transduction histidine kinase
VISQLRVVQRNAIRLQALLSDLLQVGQDNEGNLELQRAEVDLTALVYDAAEATRPGAQKLGVTIETDVPDHLSVPVDGQRIRQVVDNLLSNAVKYTGDGGSVTVILRQRGDAVELEVSDTGIGIAPDEVDQVFIRFFRGGQALKLHIPGTGLGLNIVSSIVAAHGGAVALESELGRGSTFRVTLPSPTDDRLDGR